MGNKFKIEYSYCLSEFFKKKLNDKYYDYYTNIYKKNNINIFYADDVEYFKKINNWILNDELNNYDLSEHLENLILSN